LNHSALGWPIERSLTSKTFEEALANLKEATALYLSEFPQATKGRAILTTYEVSSLVHA
jgi:hypothetical protein